MGMKLPAYFKQNIDVHDITKLFGLRSNRDLSQNFFIHPHGAAPFVDKIGLKPKTLILEVGCGPGAITRSLVSKAADQEGCKVIGFEIDKRFKKSFLEPLERDSSGLFEMIYDDAKNLPHYFKKRYAGDYENLMIVGNLPFHIGTRFIHGWLFDSVAKRHFFSIPNYDMLFMLQKEVVDRILAPCNTKNYSFLSVVCQVLSKAENMGQLNPFNFYPRPKVAIQMVRFHAPENLLPETFDLALFKHLLVPVMEAKKSLALKALALKSELLGVTYGNLKTIFTEANISHEARGISISREQWINLVCVFNEFIRCSYLKSPEAPT
jgi:dimethyladenosine transferase 1